MTESATATEPREILRERLSGFPVPIPRKELVKGLKKPGGQTADAFARSLEAILAEEIVSGRAFLDPSGPKGADRYWHRDEKEVLRDAILAGAAKPAKLSLLKKLAKEATKADRAFADAVVDELVAAGQLHPHPGPGAPHGRERHVSRNDREKVGEAILRAAAAPAKLSDLIARSQAATGADKSFVAALATEFIDHGLLHPHGTAKTAAYGRDKPRPPHPFEVGSGKAAFAKLVASARKLLVSIPAIAADELLERLRGALAEDPLAPAAAPPAEIVPTPSAPPVPEPRPSPAGSGEIGIGLKSAYDELCGRVVFLRDRAGYHRPSRSDNPEVVSGILHRDHPEREFLNGLRPRPQERRQARKTPVLDADQARQLLDSINTVKLSGLRDRALIAVMLFSFARVSAAVALKTEDYYFYCLAYSR